MGYIVLFLVLFFHLDAADYPYALSVGLQGEGIRLTEWIEYHKLVGVEHFYIPAYYKDEVIPYLITGEVELFKGDVYPAAHGKTKWLAILEAHEFLVPLQGNSLLKILKSFDEGIALHSLEFGITKFPKGESLLEWMTRCSKKPRILGKGIICPDKGMEMTQESDKILIYDYRLASDKNQARENPSMLRFIPKLRVKLGLDKPEKRKRIQAVAVVINLEMYRAL